MCHYDTLGKEYIMTRFQGHYKIDWISIKEQQPKETGYYFCCHSNKLPSGSRYSIELWIASGNDWIQGTRNRDSIEYWAYLPDLPEGFNEEW